MHRLIINGQLVLFGTIGDVFLFSEDYFTAREVIEALAQMSGDITVRLNSIGGLADEGTAAYHALRDYPGKVTVIVEGIAASAASLIAMAGDRIVMRKGARMMIHDPAQGTDNRGTAAEHLKTAEQLEKTAGEYADIYATRTGQSKDKAREIMVAETYLTADEAVALGFADEIDDGAGQAVAMIDYALNDNAPSFLFRISRTVAAMTKPAAHAAPPHQKETSMTLEQLIAMLAARFGIAADEVKMTLNQAMMAGIEQPGLVALVKDAATMVAAKDAIKGKVTEMLGAVQPTAVTPPVQQPAGQPAAATTMTAVDVNDLYRRGASAGLDIATVNTIMTAANQTRDGALAAIIDKVAEMNGGGRSPTATAHVTEDARDKFREGASLALMAKVGHKDGQRNEFSGLSMAELAREALMVAGVTDAKRMDRMLMIGTAFTGGGATMIGGMHSTSDFAFILQNVAAKSALKGYQEAEETFQLWTSKGEASDFKPIARVDLGLFPNLAKVEEGGEYKYAKIGDRGVTVVLATYGRMIAITRQAIINDDMSILGRLPIKMGRAAKRTVGNLVYGVLVNNPNFVDGVPVFHADHGNLASVAANPSAAAWEAAVNAMGSQTDDDEIATALNIRPKYFLSGAHEFLAQQLLTSTGSLEAQKSAAVANTVKGLVTPITDRRIPGNQWFMAADPNQFDTIEVTYLDGNEEPVVESKDGWNIDGTELKVRLDAGVNPLDYRGLFKNAGV
ncbi:MAG TPA: ClpP-like prohead protease/major capsid protein fusion protein [Devosia sp.]|jgi:ATP-dependent protease ClpP protease subunit|nr:ClpP-like prohead protease/major capsid protein fusion protein [Devosia sp.]